MSATATAACMRVAIKISRGCAITRARVSVSTLLLLLLKDCLANFTIGFSTRRTRDATSYAGIDAELIVLQHKLRHDRAILANCDVHERIADPLLLVDRGTMTVWYARTISRKNTLLPENINRLGSLCNLGLKWIIAIGLKCYFLLSRSSRSSKLWKISFLIDRIFLSRLYQSRDVTYLIYFATLIALWRILKRKKRIESRRPRAWPAQRSRYVRLLNMMRDKDMCPRR